MASIQTSNNASLIRASRGHDSPSLQTGVLVRTNQPYRGKQLQPLHEEALDGQRHACEACLGHHQQAPTTALRITARLVNALPQVCTASRCTAASLPPPLGLLRQHHARVA